MEKLNLLLKDRDNFMPSAVIELLKEDPQLKNLFEGGAGVKEGYTVEEHTQMVLNQFNKYFAKNMSEDKYLFFIKLLLMHDIGKSKSVQNQHSETINILHRLPEQYFHGNEKALAVALIDGDSLGKYFTYPVSASVKEVVDVKSLNEPYIKCKFFCEKNSPDGSVLLTVRGPITKNESGALKHMFPSENTDSLIEKSLAAGIDEAIKKITKAASESGKGSRAFLLEYLLIFFQSDTSSYTADSTYVKGTQRMKGYPSLEFLYELDENGFMLNGNLLKFAKEWNVKWELLLAHLSGS